MSICASGWGFTVYQICLCFHFRGVRESVRKSLKNSEIILNAWQEVLFNALKVWKWGFVKSKKSLKSDWNLNSHTPATLLCTGLNESHFSQVTDCLWPEMSGSGSMWSQSFFKILTGVDEENLLSLEYTGFILHELDQAVGGLARVHRIHKYPRVHGNILDAFYSQDIKQTFLLIGYKPSFFSSK